MAVILPKAWLAYFSLQAGDRVELISNGHITITPLVKNATAPKNGTILPRKISKND